MFLAVINDSGSTKVATPPEPGQSRRDVALHQALRHSKRLRGIGLIAMVVLMASGCPSAYHEAFRLGERSHVATPEYDLYFAEADDEGWFTSPARGDGAVSARTKSNATSDTIVVTLVNVWHN